MKNMLPRTLRFAVILLVASVTVVVNAQDWAKARLEESPRHREYVALSTATARCRRLWSIPR